MVTRVVSALDRWQRRHPALGFPVAVISKYVDDGGWRLAALLAYYGFIAIFPLLLTFVTVLRLLLPGHPDWQAALLRSAIADVPVVGDQLRLAPMYSDRWVLIASLVVTVWGARGVALAQQHALNDMWDVPAENRPGPLAETGRAVAVLVVTGFGVLVTGGLSEVGGWGNWGSTAVRVGALTLSTLVSIGTFGLAFRFSIAISVKLRAVAVSAVATALLWQGLLALGGLYVTHVARHAQSLYGAFGLVLGLLAWLQLLAGLSLIAVEADVVRARSLWPRKLLPAPRDPDADVSVAAEASPR
jgi:membrane protein